MNELVEVNGRWCGYIGGDGRFMFKVLLRWVLNWVFSFDYGVNMKENGYCCGSWIEIC